MWGALNSDAAFQQSLALTQSISEGEIWVTGSAVYRRLAEQMHGLPVEELHDYDFIVENLKLSLDIPKVWQQTSTNAGELRLVHAQTGLQVDCLRLNNVVSLADRLQVEQLTTEQKLESYFSKVPLTIQAIAFNIRTQNLIGAIGIAAVTNKEIKLNALTDEFKSYCERRDMTIDECLQRKADNLKFTIIK